MDSTTTHFRSRLLLSLGLVLPLGGQADEAEKNIEKDRRGNFERSIKSDSIYGVTPFSQSDLAREYIYRTVEDNAPSLNTEISRSAEQQLGPRILVEKIQFSRLEEFPEHNITRESVEQFVENLRVKYMKEDQIFASGYTRDNLEEIAAYLEKVGARKSVSNLNAENLQQLIDIIKIQNEERGISYVELEEIAEELTGFYRKNGLFLASVQIPEQIVENGVVTFFVQEGVLGKVAVSENKHYRESLLESPFENGLGKLVSHDKVEESLYLLNDLAGLSLSGHFSAGDNPGETALNLVVRDEQRWRASLRADNHGSRFTGDKRNYLVGELLNPLGIGDRLTLGHLRSTDPDNTKLYQVGYSLPVFGPRTRLEFGAEKNRFALEDADESIINRLGLQGVNESYSVTLDHKFYRSRDFNFTAGLEFADKRTELNSIGAIFDQRERAHVAKLNLYMDSLGKSVRIFNVANMALSYGEHQTPVDAGRGDSFEKLAIDTSSLFFIPLPFTDAESRFILKGRGLYSQQSLPSFEQQSLGGASGVRGYTVREFSGDQMALINAEWYFDVPQFLNVKIPGDRYLSDIIQFGLVADAGYGVQVNYEGGLSNSWAYLSSYGGLIKISWDDRFSTQFVLSRPYDAKSSIEGLGEEAESLQMYIDFNIQF